MRRFDKLSANGCGIVVALFLSACQAAPEDPRAVTPDEQAQLNDAAAMLDANSVSANALSNEDAP